MNDQTKEAVRKAYREIALDSRRTLDSTGPATELCGYDEGELALLPEGAVLGLGCGNPLGIADAKQGEVVLDLGSGAGIDCFLAASQVGASGRVIGVDITLGMIERATRNAQSGGYANVEFRLGDIAHLPLPDASTDLVISNCVIDLVLDQSAVFSEAYRVLRPGGRVVISDTVGSELSAAGIGAGARAALRVACVLSVSKDEYLANIRQAGFQDVTVIREAPYPPEIALEEALWRRLRDDLGVAESTLEAIANSMRSITIRAVKRDG